MIKQAWKYAGLVAGGFLIGSAGIKAVTSKTARKFYVWSVSQGLKAKNASLSVIEDAKANLDDVVAEASYLTQSKDDAGESAEDAK
jgi:hypothetical protein